MGGVCLSASDATWGPEAKRWKHAHESLPRGFVAVHGDACKFRSFESKHRKVGLGGSLNCAEWYKSSEFAERKGKGGGTDTPHP